MADDDEDYRLCRREVGTANGGTRLCNKTIRQKNALNWCPDCRTRLPFWPTDDKNSSPILVKTCVESAR